MPRALSISALGAVIRIDGTALTRDAWSAVERAWHDAVAGDGNSVTSASAVTAHGSVHPPAMLSRLSTDVTLAALEARAGEMLMLHAAGLATPQGHVVALVAPSGRGKTTASRVLGRQLGYVSDESVGILPDGSVRAYRKPLSLIEHDRLPKVQRSPGELGLLPLPSVPLRLAALVLLDRIDGVNPPRLETVGLDEGVVGLSQQASYLGRLSSPLHVIASHIESVGGVHRLIYSDAATLFPLISELSARRPDEPRHVTDVVSDSPVERRTRPHHGGPTYIRVAVLDALTLGDQRVVLLLESDGRPTRVVMLDGIAPALWHHAVQQTEFAALIDAAVAAYGDPVGATAANLVEVSLTELIAAGILAKVR